MDNLHEGKLQNGSDEAESDSFSKVIPLVALYAGNKDLKKKIEEVVRTTLNNDKAVRCFGRFSLNHHIYYTCFFELRKEMFVENIPYLYFVFPVIPTRNLSFALFRWLNMCPQFNLSTPILNLQNNLRKFQNLKVLSE